MPLLNRNNFPPGGFSYREAAVNWATPTPGLPFAMVVQQIQAIRIQNPGAGLNPSYEACADALDLYTCTRLRNNPAFCSQPQSAVAAVAEESRKAVVCASCGSKRKKKT